MGPARNIRRCRNVFPLASPHVEEVRSSDVLGPRAIPPATSAQRENNFEKHLLKILCTCGALRAGRPRSQQVT